MNKTYYTTQTETPCPVVEEAVIQFGAPKAKPIQLHDNPYREVRTRYGFKQAEMIRLAGVSLRTLTALENLEKEPTQLDLRRIRELEGFFEQLEEVITATEIRNWMTKPNNYFGGATPLQLVERGDVDQLWQMIMRLQHGIPLQ